MIMLIRRPFLNRFGFSLVEVMLVTALLAILLSLATPSYLGFKQRSQRTQAIAGLLQVASCQERVRAALGMYDTRQCLPTGNQHYNYRFEPPATQASTSFRVFAEPVETRSTDKCGAMILDQDGHRSVGNSNADTSRCWAGR